MISSAGYRIGLYNTPAPIRELQGNEMWTLENAGTFMERSFRPAIGAGPITFGGRPRDVAPPGGGEEKKE